MVSGAGSATGNSCLEGCSTIRSSLNLIELKPNGSAALKVLKFEGGDYRPIAQLVLLNSRSARKLRLLRSVKELKHELNKPHLEDH